MPRNPLPLPPEQLYRRRLALRGLERALDGIELLTVAIRFNADDPRECFHGTAEEVFFREPSAEWRWDPLAEVIVNGSSARVIVEDIRRLIRSNHLPDFEPEALGIISMPGQPDIDVTVDLADIIEQDGDLLRSAPQRIPPRGAGPYHRPTVIRSVRGGR